MAGLAAVSQALPGEPLGPGRPVSNLPVIRLPEGSVWGQQSPTGFTRPLPPHQVTIQLPTDRSNFPPLAGEGRSCSPRDSGQQGKHIPSHRPPATNSNPGSLARLPRILSFPPLSLVEAPLPLPAQPGEEEALKAVCAFIPPLHLSLPV